MSERKSLDVAASPRQAHSRVISTRPVTFQCAACGEQVTEDRYPGPTPTYCRPCGEKIARENNARRVREHREKKRRGRPAG